MSRASDLLRHAADIVGGARNATHGEKERSFQAIADLWEAYLSSRVCGGCSIGAADVAAMMVLMKIARSLHGQHIEDHGVDAAGYAGIWGELREAETKAPAAAGPDVSPLPRPGQVFAFDPTKGLPDIGRIGRNHAEAAE